MNDKDRRILLWIGWGFDGLLWLAGGLMFLANTQLRSILITYENQYALHDAKSCLLLGILITWLFALLILAGLIVEEWQDFKQKFTQTLEHGLRKVSQTALKLAAKIAPKSVSQSAPPVPPTQPAPQSPPAPQKQPVATPVVRRPPPPPDPPAPQPPKPAPEPPPPPPDLIPSYSRPRPDFDPHSGAGALPIPTPPIHRMASAVA